MSLDVCLLSEPKTEPCPECQHPREIREKLFEANITHNLNRMAEAAGIYMHLWRPEEIGITKASQLIEPLQKGLALMRAEPEKFRRYDAFNGWGLYDHFVPWIERYLLACYENPDSIIEVSR